MTDVRQFPLPDVGEGLTEADIVSWRVKPGDTVAVNQVIVEVETAKAVVELPCPFDGVVTELLVDEGRTVDVGTPIIAVDVAPQDRDSGEPRPAVSPTTAEGAPGDGPHHDRERPALLVGYGVKPSATTRRRRKAGHAAAVPESAPAPHPEPEPIAPPSAAPQARAVPAVLAKPPVRKLAKDLGVDLAALAGTGPQGSITRDDVRRASGSVTAASSAEDLVTAPGSAVAAGAAADGRREQRIPVRGVRKHTAEAMTASAFTAPHVTEFLQADVTETVAALRRLRELPDFAEVRISPLLLVAKALLVAVARHRLVNSTWDEAAREIVVKRYVNLGIAVATPRGLLVPNIKDAHALPLPALAGSLADLAATARAGTCTPAQLTGGTITITNVGVFGVDAGTPILAPGEAAILAFGQIRDTPWVHDGQIAVRAVTTLSLSFDHRIVDGELGSAVLRDVAAMLADPVRMIAWG